MKDTRGVAPRELLNFVEAVLTTRRSSEEHALEKIVLFLRIFSCNIYCKEQPFKSIGRNKSPMLFEDSSRRVGGGGATRSNGHFRQRVSSPNGTPNGSPNGPPEDYCIYCRP